MIWGKDGMKLQFFFLYFFHPRRRYVNILFILTKFLLSTFCRASRLKKNTRGEQIVAGVER